MKKTINDCKNRHLPQSKKPSPGKGKASPYYYRVNYLK